MHMKMLCLDQDLSGFARAVLFSFSNSHFDVNRYLSSTEEANLPDEILVCCPWKGVLIYIVGAFCMALGVNLQKFSINREAHRYSLSAENTSENLKKQRGLWCQPLWVIGLIMYASSGVLLSLALAFAKQSQLAPLMSVVIISNALLSRFLLSEPICQRDISAITIIVCAVVLSTVFAPSSDNVLHTTEGLIELYKAPAFVIFVIMLAMLILGLYFGNKYIEAKIEQEPSKIAKFIARRFNIKSNKISIAEERFYACSFGAQAGVWGGLCVTMMKSAISIIVQEFTESKFKGIFTNPLMYALLAVLICCWTMQLYWIALGLKNYPAVFVISLEAILNELVAVCGGILYFQEYTAFIPVTATMFVIGLAMGVCGICIFASRDNDISIEDDFFWCCPLMTFEHFEEPVDRETRLASWKSGHKDVRVLTL